MFLPLTKESIRKQINDAPGKTLAFPELLERFGHKHKVELLVLLFRMRDDYPPIWFKGAWLDVTQLAVTTVRPEKPEEVRESEGFRRLKRPGRKVRLSPG